MFKLLVILYIIKLYAEMICLKNHNAITEEVKEIALSANDNKRIQSIVLIETYAF